MFKFILQKQLSILTSVVALLLIGTLALGYYEQFVQDECMNRPIIENPSPGQDVYRIQLTYCLQTVPSLSSMTLFSLFLSLIPLLFLSVAVYKSWRTFAVWYWPIALFLILISPGSNQHSYLPTTFTREMAAITFSVLFVVISYMLMLAKSQQLRKRK